LPARVRFQIFESGKEKKNDKNNRD